MYVCMCLRIGGGYNRREIGANFPQIRLQLFRYKSLAFIVFAVHFSITHTYIHTYRYNRLWRISGYFCGNLRSKKRIRAGVYVCVCCFQVLCMYVCMYADVYVCMYVCMYACLLIFNRNLNQYRVCVYSMFCFYDYKKAYLKLLFMYVYVCMYYALYAKRALNSAESKCLRSCRRKLFAKCCEKSS